MHQPSSTHPALDQCYAGLVGSKREVVERPVCELPLARCQQRRDIGMSGVCQRPTPIWPLFTSTYHLKGEALLLSPSLSMEQSPSTKVRQSWQYRIYAPLTIEGIICLAVNRLVEAKCLFEFKRKFISQCLWSSQACGATSAFILICKG